MSEANRAGLEWLYAGFNAFMRDDAIKKKGPRRLVVVAKVTGFTSPGDFAKLIFT